MEIFDYDNILLLPRKCRVDSRAECDASVEFGGRRFALPVVPANMKTVLDEPVAAQLAARLNGARLLTMNDADLDDLAAAEDVVFVTSTFGDGGPPDNGAEFWDRLGSADAPALDGVPR